jgi:hypothetical protein
MPPFSRTKEVMFGTSPLYKTGLFYFPAAIIAITVLSCVLRLICLLNIIFQSGLKIGMAGKKGLFVRT